jgi:hypothetical protein
MRPNGTGVSAGLACLLVSGLAIAQPAPSPSPTPEPVPVAPTAPADPAPAPVADPAAATAPEPVAAPAAESSSGSSASSRGTPLGTAFGVGVHAFLTGPYGPAIVYNMHRFHVEGIIAFANSGGTTLALGGKFWFHVHQTRSSTLSLGGGAAFVQTDTGMPDPRGGTIKTTDIALEGGAQIRFFATENVSLSAAVGLAIVTGDGDFVGLTGQLQGAVGLTYFLF